MERKAEVNPLSEVYILEGEERLEIPIHRESPDISISVHENKEVHHGKSIIMSYSFHHSMIDLACVEYSDI